MNCEGRITTGGQVGSMGTKATKGAQSFDCQILLSSPAKPPLIKTRPLHLETCFSVPLKENENAKVQLILFLAELK